MTAGNLPGTPEAVGYLSQSSVRERAWRFDADLVTRAVDRLVDEPRIWAAASRVRAGESAAGVAATMVPHADNGAAGHLALVLQGLVAVLDRLDALGQDGAREVGRDGRQLRALLARDLLAPPLSIWEASPGSPPAGSKARRARSEVDDAAEVLARVLGGRCVTWPCAEPVADSRLPGARLWCRDHAPLRGGDPGGPEKARAAVLRRSWRLLEAVAAAYSRGDRLPGLRRLPRLPRSG